MGVADKSTGNARPKDVMRMSTVISGIAIKKRCALRSETGVRWSNEWVYTGMVNDTNEIPTGRLEKLLHSNPTFG
jgi:hypothetical protein